MTVPDDNAKRPVVRSSAWDLIEKEGFLFTPPISKVDERSAIEFDLDKEHVNFARSGKLYCAVLQKLGAEGGILYFFHDDKTYSYFSKMQEGAGSEINALVFLAINYRKEERSPHFDFTNICDIISNHLSAEASISSKDDNSIEIRVRRVVENFSNKDVLLDKIENACLALSLAYRCGIKIFYSNFSEYYKGTENVLGDFIFELLPEQQQIKVIDRIDLIDIERSINQPRSRDIARGLQNFYDQRSGIARIAIGWAAVERLILKNSSPEHILDTEEIAAVKRILEEYLDIDSDKKTLLTHAIADKGRMQKMTRNSIMASRIASLLGLEYDTAWSKIRDLHKIRGKVVHCIYDDSAEQLLPSENFIERILTELYFVESSYRINHLR